MGEILFMYSQGLCICTWFATNKKHPEGAKKKYRNQVELKKSGLTICLGIDHRFDTFHPFGDMNIVRTPKYYHDIVVKNAALMKNPPDWLHRDTTSFW